MHFRFLDFQVKLRVIKRGEMKTKANISRRKADGSDGERTVKVNCVASIDACDVHEWIKITRPPIGAQFRSFRYLLGNQLEVDHVELLILFHRQVVKAP